MNIHNCALNSSGNAWCWGYNAQGQDGDGTLTSPRRVPTAVAMPSSVTFSLLSTGAVANNTIALAAP
jgi:hypothetical protein